ncbi:MAG: PfkB family carbohydrate kinase [Planctomycetota bacterium]
MTTTAAHVLQIDELAEETARLRAEGKRVVHCHGVFDLLHVGHLRYFEQAREMGDALVVTVTPDRFVNKGPGRPAFPEALRAEHIAALKCVDFAAVNDWPRATEAIERLQPDLYVKGSEYKDDQDVTGAIAEERAAVEAAGGELAFTDDIVFSSSNLLNRFFPQLPDKARRYLKGFSEKFGIDAVEECFEKMSTMRALVIGETIVDEYQYGTAIGKSSKEPTLVVKCERLERFAGGVLAVANNSAAAVGAVDVVTQLGDRNRQEDFLREKLAERVAPSFLTRQGAPTIVKRRLVDSYFFTKMIEMYEIEDGPPKPADTRALIEAVEAKIDEADLVLVVDFGHGMIAPELISVLTQRAKFLAVNTQANAGNFGYHTLGKYPRADLACVAEGEMRLEARDPSPPIREVMDRVRRRIDCGTLVTTRGKHGCLCWNRDLGFVETPAVAAKVVDRVGAGDTFLSLMAPALAAGAPVEVAAFIGSVAGAEAVATVGHRRYLDRGSLLRHVHGLLK